MARGLLIGIALGIAVGIGAGWILFAADAPRQRTETRAETTPSDRKREAEPSPPAPAVEEITSPHDIAPVRARIERARAERDWKAFRSALRALDGSGPGAEELLVEVMADRRLRFQEDLGREFKELLRDAKAPGIGEAALFRLSDCVERGDHMDAASWAVLVARSGNATVLGELAGVLPTYPEEARSQVVRALAHEADRPEVAVVLERLYADDPEELRGNLLTQIAVVALNNPALGYRLARERFEDADYGSIQPIANALWLGATPRQRDEAKALILAIEEERKLFHALDVVLWDEDLRQIEGLEPALERVLSRIEGPDRGSAFGAARNLVLERKILWTPRALVALEANAPHVAAPDREDYEERLEEIRVHLGVPKNRWDPNRRG